MSEFIGPMFEAKRIWHGEHYRNSEILLSEANGRSLLYDYRGDKIPEMYEDDKNYYPHHNTYDRYVKAWVEREKIVM